MEGKPAGILWPRSIRRSSGNLRSVRSKFAGYPSRPPARLSASQVGRIIFYFAALYARLRTIARKGGGKDRKSMTERLTLYVGKET